MDLPSHRQHHQLLSDLRQRGLINSDSDSQGRYQILNSSDSPLDAIMNNRPLPLLAQLEITGEGQQRQVQIINPIEQAYGPIVARKIDHLLTQLETHAPHLSLSFNRETNSFTLIGSPQDEATLEAAVNDANNHSSTYSHQLRLRQTASEGPFQIEILLPRIIASSSSNSPLDPLNSNYRTNAVSRDTLNWLLNSQRPRNIRTHHVREMPQELGVRQAQAVIAGENPSDTEVTPFTIYTAKLPENSDTESSNTEVFEEGIPMRQNRLQKILTWVKKFFTHS